MAIVFDHTVKYGGKWYPAGTPIDEPKKKPAKADKKEASEADKKEAAGDSK